MIEEKQLLAKLQIEDLQEQHQEFAEVIGVDNLIRLSERFGGNSIYVPQKEELIKLKIHAEIRQEYQNGNISVKALSRKYHVSSSTVYNVLRGMLRKGADKREIKVNIPGQQNLMDYLLETEQEGIL